jgi:predicted ester cyclase
MARSSRFTGHGTARRDATTSLRVRRPDKLETSSAICRSGFQRDGSLSKEQAEAQIRAARNYDTFLTTGDEAKARAALADTFIDRTLPPGRPQGIAGPLAASKMFHAAVPDVQASVEQMIVAGDRVVTHLRSTGHFTGTFNGVQGKGQPVDFIATDIYRIRDGKITDNWHLEDNLIFLQQLGVAAK